MKKSTPPSAFFQQNNYLKKGGELIITYQLEYYEKKSYKQHLYQMFFCLWLYDIHKT